MRVLQVHAGYRHRGGEDAVVEQEAALLRAGGHQVISAVYPNPRSPVQAAISLTAAPWNVPRARTVAADARRVEPDVIHVHNTWFSVSLASLASLRRLDRPIVVTLHNYRLSCVNGLFLRAGYPCEDCVGRTIGWPGAIHRCYRDSYAQSSAAAVAGYVARRTKVLNTSADAITTPTAFALGKAVQAGLDPSLLIVRPNFAWPSKERTLAPSESRSYLYVGRLSPEKGVATLLAAWSSRLTNAGLRVVGGGPSEQALRDMSSASVTFLGNLPPDEVRGEMNRSRALLVPSRWYEVQPMVILEAFASGLPVVASAVGGLPDLVGRAGITVEGPEPELWMETLEALTDAQVDVMGSEAAARWSLLFSPEVALKNMESLYRGIGAT